MSKPYFLPSNLTTIRGLFNIYLTFIRKVLNRYAFYVIGIYRLLIIRLNFSTSFVQSSLLIPYLYLSFGCAS